MFVQYSIAPVGPLMKRRQIVRSRATFVLIWADSIVGHSGFIMLRCAKLKFVKWLVAGLALMTGLAIQATTLWSDLGATLAHETGDGADILGGAVKRDNTSTDTLYFKVHVDPLSDVSTEEYFAGFELFEGTERKLAVGNAMKAWAYSAFHTSEKGEFNKFSGDYDLHSARPESTAVGVFKLYEQPRRGIERTIVFKVQYVAGADDLVTVWLSPDLDGHAAETNQLESLTTRFKADCSFDEIHLRHGGGGDGWTFSDMAIATSFNDFVSGNDVNPGKFTAAGHGALALSFRSWQQEQGLPQSSIQAITQTRDGYLWLGTDAGLVRFDGVRFVPFGEREGLYCGAVRSILEDSRGAIWIGSATNGLTRWQEGTFIKLTTQDGLPSDSITALAEDGAGQLWIGTPAGLVLHRAGGIVPPPDAESLEHKAIAGLVRDHKGDMWVAVATAGIFQFQGGTFNLISNASVGGLLQDAHCLLVDKRDRVWVGAGDDFVLCRDDGQWSRYRIPRHLDKPFIKALAETPDGTVWAGSVREGLFQFKDGKVKPINAGGGLLDNFVESLFVDREGNLWIGVSAGLSQLRCRNFPTKGTASSGVAGEAPSPGNGSPAPAVILEEVLLDGAPVLSDTTRKTRLSNLRVPPGRHRLEFRYTGLSFMAPERIRFRYRVTGLDADWLDAANRRAAFYSYVPPGEFTFEVSACNADGVWNESPATLAFVVRPHFWQTWWFLAFAALTAFVGVGGSIRFIEKRKVQRQVEHLEHERALERERSRIAQDLHDDLGASLSRISLLSDMAQSGQPDRSQTAVHVARISQLANHTLRALDEIVWAVRPGSDTLQSVVEYIAHFANELFKGNGVRCRLDLPENLPPRQLPPEMRHNIFLIAKEALTNAFKHSAAHEISVQIKVTGSRFEMQIQDDGRGFHAGGAPSERDGNGLENLRQRAESIGAALQMNSAPGRGTTITLTVDLARNGRAANVSA